MKPRTEMRDGVTREHSQQRKRDIVAISGLAENPVHAMEYALDERLQWGRDIIHEIERDGCVRGSFGSDPS